MRLWRGPHHEDGEVSRGAEARRDKLMCIQIVDVPRLPRLILLSGNLPGAIICENVLKKEGVMDVCAEVMIHIHSFLLSSVSELY